MKAVIVGGGQVGSYMAELLTKNGCDFRIIESDKKAADKLIERFGQRKVTLGDGASPTILESSGIRDADVVAAVTGRDETNLVISTISKFEFQAPRVISKVNNPANSWLFTIGMGVDAAINQADIIGHMVVEEMSMKSLMTLMKLSRGSYSIIQLTVSERSKTIDMQIKDIKMPESALMIAIYRGESLIIPHGSTTIHPGDKIMFFTSEEIHAQLDDLFNPGRLAD
ncbi:MAG TPA: hypothetical protein DEA32_02325 [Firmicutes bacterium]|nr:hypothetical protein [Bacillota bacterium]